HGQERLVDEDPVGLRVADDVGEVFRGQAQVELEHGRGDSGNGEVELEVAAGVPVEDPDHRSGADAQFAQSVSQLRHAAEFLGVVRPTPGAVGAAVDDLGRTEDRGRMPDEVGGV